MPQLTRLGRNAAFGAILGGLVGILLIGVGLLRAVVVLVGGGSLKPPSADDLRVLAFYAGGFAAAGGALGAAKPLLHTRFAIAVGCMVAGVIVVLAIAAGEKGGLASLDRGDWVVLPLLGVVFGAAAAISCLRNR
jgi:hypothetical protein